MFDNILADLHGRPGHVWLQADADTLALTSGRFAGVRAYLLDEPRPHWHLITCGLSELGDAGTPAPERSGFGFELTCRIPWEPKRSGFFRQRIERPSQPPDWGYSLLANLARYVFTKSCSFTEGDHFQQPGALDGTSAFTAFLFAVDDALGSYGTSNGHLDFFQVVGVQPDELSAAEAWSGKDILALLHERDPLLLTDPARPSLLTDAAMATRVRAGVEAEGPRHAVRYVDQLSWFQGGGGGNVEVALGAAAAALAREAIPRLLHRDRRFICAGKPTMLSSSIVAFARAAQCSWHVDPEGILIVELSDDLIDRFAEGLVPPAVLEWEELPGFRLRLVPNEPVSGDERG